jgi:hypothetical protein
LYCKEVDIEQYGNAEKGAIGQAQENGKDLGSKN